ncbi:unnamed protein product [Cylicocyclus nassatus]|uniref:Uncharacterized protein n=1 Tax=Cylicocyclus nassatus TaxID=53992 RepID=A0AA36H1L3_CYLNA|nr:unnamed protein product [Cylicocyclus nassatus]
MTKVDDKKRKPSLVADRTKSDKADIESTKKDSPTKEARDRQVEKEKPKKTNSTEEPAKIKKAEEKPIPIEVVVKQAELGKIDPFEDRPKIPRTKDESRRDSLTKDKNKDPMVGKSEKISVEKANENSSSKAAGKADANSVRRKTLEKVSGIPPTQKGAMDKSSPLEKKQFSAFAEERKAKMRGDKPAEGSPQRKGYGHVGKKQKHDSFSDEDKGGASEKPQPRSDAQRNAKRDQSPEANLTAHVEVIRERRMSLPRTITTDPAADVEIVIGDDGKPVFQPTMTPKADEILRELTKLVVEDETGKGRVPKLIPS